MANAVSAAPELFERVLVADLKVGDKVDLEGDRYADPKRDNPHLADAYVLVEEVERETDTCVRVDFEDFDSIGFPANHLVLRAASSAPRLHGGEATPSQVVDFLRAERARRFSDAGDDKAVVADWNGMLDVIEYLERRYGLKAN